MDFNALVEKKLPQLIEWGQGFVPKLLLAIVIFYIGRAIVRRLSGATIKGAQRVPTIDLTLARFLGSLVLFAGLAAVSIAALSAMNVPLGFIATIVGALMVALGFALQESLGDLASGVMLAFFRPYKVGDEVEIGGEYGVVKQLDIFTTTLITVDNVELVIGNGTAFGGVIKNYHGFGERRLDMDFGVGYEANLDAAIAAVKSAADGDKRIKASPEPWAKITSLGDSAVNVQLRVWCAASDYKQIKMDMSQRVKSALDKAGIDIPYEHCMIIPMKAK
ncbi:MAG: mechanosensitive ion channel domain-containing protein [Robiginitomaculum sp.]